MGEIISFKKPETDEHVTGPAVCVGCGKSWIAVAPVGVSTLDCPKCETNRGVFTQLMNRCNSDHWQCNCGSEFFSLTRKGAYCVKCGAWATGWCE